MPRRFAPPLLSVVLALANVLAGVATCVAVCSSTRLAMTDCCKRPEAGVSAPRCCQGAERLGANVTPVAATSRTHAAGESIFPVAVAVPIASVSLPAPLASRLVATAAPPGTSALVVQRTSLLL